MDLMHNNNCPNNIFATPHSVNNGNRYNNNTVDTYFTLEDNINMHKLAQ